MDTLETQLRNYLEAVTKCRASMALPKNFVYAGNEDLILKAGTWLSGGQTMTDEQNRVVLAAIDNAECKCEVRQCFHNSQTIAIFDATKRLVYFEGWAIGAASFPIHHGWLVLDGKIVIDTTWRAADRQKPVMGQIPREWAYAGVPFETKEIRRRILKEGATNSILDDYRFPPTHLTTVHAAETSRLLQIAT